MSEKTFLAGRYYVGDLCYVNKLGSTDLWDKMVELVFPGDNRTGVWGFHEVDGILFWEHGTAYGDGTYDSNQGIDFPVDSGSIGVVAAEVAELMGFDGGHIVEFHSEFTPSYEDGIFYIGGLTIYTESQEEDEEGDSEDEDQEENE